MFLVNPFSAISISVKGKKVTQLLRESPIRADDIDNIIREVSFWSLDSFLSHLNKCWKNYGWMCRQSRDDLSLLFSFLHAHLQLSSPPSSTLHPSNQQPINPLPASRVELNQTCLTIFIWVSYFAVHSVALSLCCRFGL